MSTVAERAAAERSGQGLPPHVEDEAVLEWVATLLAEGGDRLAEGA